MRAMIEIPKEFEEHFERDRFEDSLQRLIVDSHCAAGRYERELCVMLIEAFKNAAAYHRSNYHIMLLKREEEYARNKENSEDV